MRQNAFRIEIGATCHHRMHAVAPFFVRDTNHCRFDHPFDFEQHILDFARIDVVTAGDQHVVFAIENIEITGVIHATDIAGV